jgi:hypothetical protein
MDPENQWPLMLYSVVVSIWSCLFVEAVCRSSIRYAVDWGMFDYRHKEQELDAFTFVSRRRRRPITIVACSLAALQLSDDSSYGYYESGGAWVSLRDYARTIEDPDMVESLAADSWKQRL